MDDLAILVPPNEKPKKNRKLPLVLLGHQSSSRWLRTGKNNDGRGVATCWLTVTKAAGRAGEPPGVIAKSLFGRTIGIGRKTEKKD